MKTSSDKEHYSIEDYNSEPVYYCKHCLSLAVLNIPDVPDTCYCDKCGSTDIASSSIEEWEELYQKKYGHKFVNY